MITVYSVAKSQQNGVHEIKSILFAKTIPGQKFVYVKSKLHTIGPFDGFRKPMAGNEVVSTYQKGTYQV